MVRNIAPYESQGVNVSNVGYRVVTDEEIAVMVGQGCSAVDWQSIRVADGFNALRVRGTHFIGQIRIGRLAGNTKGSHGLEKSSGIYNATIIDCSLGDNVRIANVGVHIANYDIADKVCIENVGTMGVNAGATFGNGVEIEVLNEGGGREVIIFDELTAQFAHMTCLHRYKSVLIDKLNAIANAYRDSVRSDRGKIGVGASVCSACKIIDVNIGDGAIVDGAGSLVNGTILSAVDAPTTVGSGVVADDFIIGEGSSVTEGVILSETFVGQGCQMGKQFSAEGCLFFANCEAFHGEGCSIFAGPYTVTHHKSTLLIAGLFSFYNAGSGTNQSNHMYKLGPVHEGKLERGTKTGSFSYMMWPCRVGPFGVVLGKHSSTFDTSDYPFSHHEARSDGKCLMVPGLNLVTVGTVRDGAKWPSRDRRRGSVKRDNISFDVFSPYTVGKMIKASAALKKLQGETDKSVEEVSVGGALVRRPILRTGQKFYRTGIEMYLLEKVFTKAKAAIESSGDVKNVFAVDDCAVYSLEWLDIAGQLMPRERLSDIHQAIESGSVTSIEQFAAVMDKPVQSYDADEWVWVLAGWKEVFGNDLANASADEIVAMADAYLKIKGKFLRMVIADAGKEFDELSHSGFGIDGAQDDIDADFREVRGTFEDNKFVKQMQKALEDLQSDVEAFKSKLISNKQ